MSKDTKKRVPDRDQEHTVPDETSRGKLGFLAILAALAVAGLVVWFVVNQEETG